MSSPLSTPRQPLQEILDEFGPVQDRRNVPETEAELYRGRLPDAIVDFWIEHGRGQWRDGLFWLCDPAPIMPVLETIFSEDPEFDAASMVPFKRDAFGMLTIWHPKFKIIDLNLNLGSAFTVDITTQVVEGVPPFDDDMAAASAVDGDVFDGRGWVDATTGAPVFEQVHRRLGPIRADQVYTMVPHFRLGGNGEAQDFSIGGLVEYLGVLAQMGHVTLQRYIGPNEGGPGPFGRLEPVRTIRYERLLQP